MEQRIPARDEAARRSLTPDVENRPLVIELDGALLRSSVLHEVSFTSFPAFCRDLIAALTKGRTAAGQFLTPAPDLDYASLAYDPDVLNLALSARAKGCKIYIATARFEGHASAIVSHLGFDGIFVLRDDRESANADAPSALAGALGSNGFDYVGSGDTADAIWRATATAYVVGGSEGQLNRLRALTPSLREIGSHDGSCKTTSWKTWLNALRVHQYAKNTLVFVPVLTSHQINLASLGNALLAFLAFSACASSAYLLNDLIDLKSDRRHPTKRQRAIAAGELPIPSVLVAIPLLGVASAISALCVSAVFFVVVAAYLATTIAYSLYLKKRMLVDIVTLAGLYTARIVGGAVAIGVHLSEWLLIFSLFIFTSLALIKRYGELAMRQGAGLSDPSDRDYKIGDLSIVAALAAASGMNAVTVFSMYVSSSAVTQVYSRPWMLWLLNPMLLYWIGRALMVAHRQAMHDDPIVYTFKDASSRTTVLIMMCIVLAAI